MPDIWMDVDTALAEVPVNIAALTDDTDYKTRETAIVYNQAGMDLVWNFVTTGGAMTQTAVTPTTAGNYDWAHQGDGMYSIEIPASGGVSINNNTEGFGWFTGYATGVLPWRGPTIGFRAAGLNNALIDDAYSATRGLAGTALPAAAADAVGGLPISDAGGLDLDTFLGRITGNVALASVLGALADAAADGDPTSADTVMQYLKQVINTLVGTAGIPTFPASAVPGNGVSLAEAIRQIYDETAGLNGSAVLDAAGVRTAVGLASANLDTQLSNIQTNVTTLTVGVNVTQVVGDSTAAARLNQIYSDTPSGFCDPGSSATSIIYDSSLTYDDDVIGMLLYFTSGAAAGYARTITAINAGAFTLTVSPGFNAAPANNDTFLLLPAGTAQTWNAAWDAEVQSEVQDAIEANHLDHLLAVDYDPAAKPGVATALLNELIESDAGISRYTANALEQAPTGGSAPTAAQIADAVWDEAATGHTDAGKAGEQLWTDIDAILVDTGTTLDGRIPAALVSGRMDSSVGAMAAGVVTAAAIATGAVDADALAADAANEIADAIYVRDVDQVEATAPKHSLATAVLGSVSKVDDDGVGNMDIYRTDGVTVHASRPITVNAAADPIKTLGVAV